MEKDSLEIRLKTIRNSLVNNAKEVSGKHRSTLGHRIITKWRYRKKPYDGNSMLPKNCKNHVQLYDDLIQKSSNDLAGFRLHDLQALLEKICLIQNHTRLLLVEWDVRWVNPLTLASKGWESYQGESQLQAVFKCLSLIHI